MVSRWLVIRWFPFLRLLPNPTSTFYCPTDLVVPALLSVRLSFGVRPSGRNENNIGALGDKEGGSESKNEKKTTAGYAR
ncbi:Hypothetical protein NTJ_00004 [Nesidiocoris tenuis]|uniref:Secreted protein n=1 Tax=Nesidiocoris tenuis TaxID=355587 RepID=A0ABN7A7L5_9HEMI|nr:Hypothetical protein NTJ_00004 [Nesidiocoris tenuis]